MIQEVISYGIITTKHSAQKRVAAKIRDKIIDLVELSRNGMLNETLENYFLQDSLNMFVTLSPIVRKDIKMAVLEFLESYHHDPIILAEDSVTMYMPLKVRGYTDFYASKEHAVNIGKIFRPDSPLLPNWVHMPIAYNGRASSVQLSGNPLKRPQGQVLINGKPEFALSQKVDLEVELGMVIGKNSVLGEPIPIEKAEDYIFGICVVNDWSLRDIQAWEYQPLGPFNSKSALTSISSFVTPIEELIPFKVPLKTQDPKPMSYLDDENAYTYDIKFDVKIKTEKLDHAHKIADVNFKDIYWSMKQMIAQHTITGGNLCVGDLIASGTISGEGTEHAGSLMEITVNGTKPITLPNGETRSFLLDGDELIIEAYNDNYGQHFDFGVVTGKIIS